MGRVGGDLCILIADSLLYSRNCTQDWKAIIVQFIKIQSLFHLKLVLHAITPITHRKLQLYPILSSPA